ncbi:phosphoribosylanthranilate isomerase [Hazenella coriacea]|uniref:N-(5'-phosphoribosyl)anthranilate isomerase n=1 Tax=Hazenella coriacea TaxID=1179467 RepID=A0A4R3L7B9_9BACL|nr:phosphoribosylanthranilate isomerase [Hazenella coriacea]TCS93386.1 phosphoribosylanthranilate isomerase [Hazenella coriacea]
MTWIKICGFQCEEELHAIQDLDLNAVGFVLVPGRRRTVSKANLRNMIHLVPSHLFTVGVMMDPTLQEIEDWLTEFPLRAIQLHGVESPSFCAEVKKRFSIQLIKTFHVDHQGTSTSPSSYLPWIDLALLDSVVKGKRGGTGTSFQWKQVIPPFQKECIQANLPLWIAGGLQESNIIDLLQMYTPDGVDLSSSVEIHGKKDLYLMSSFIERVRKHGSTNSQNNGSNQ